MRSKVFEGAVAVRLDIGDEIVECLKYVCEKHGIKSGAIMGIGATDNANLGVYDIERKSYEGKTVDEFCEIANLSGNVSSMNGEVYLHLHVTLGGKSGRIYAGHLQSAVISATAEIFILPFDEAIDRKRDEEHGLNIFDF